MKNIILFLVLLCTISNSMIAKPYGKNKKRKISVDNFSLVPFSEAINKDSIKIVTFLEIPYNSIQFIKNKDNYLARYQASVSIKTKSGKTILNKIWLDSIKVNNYKDTKSYIKNSKHLITKSVEIGEEYFIVGELQDIDTRKKGLIRKSINTKKFVKRPKIVDPIFLLNLDGDWGFEENLIPTKGYRVREVGNGISLKLSGFLKNEDYTLKLFLKNKNSADSLIFTKNEKNNKQFFNHLIFIPSNELQNLRNTFKVIIKQGIKVVEKEMVFSLYKPGISNFVGNIDLAIREMRYILTNEEALELKELNKSEKEDFFFTLWKKRDPTPKTDSNELMEEYYLRVNYTNEHFDGWQAGWETDRGKIYILFGPPDEIQRSNSNLNNSYQIWFYNKVNKQFRFKDQNGFGDYRLDVPFLGSGF